MKVELYDYTPLKLFIDLIHDESSSINLLFDAEGLKINLLNKPKTCFYNLFIDRNGFGDYDVNTESYTIDSEDLFNVLKSASKNELLTLSSKENSSLLVCKFGDVDTHRVFEFPLVDSVEDVPPVPSINYNGGFDLKLDDLKKSCDDLSRIIKTDDMRFQLADNILNIVSPTDFLMNYHNQIHIDSDLKAKTAISINYLMGLTKLGKLSEIIHLELGDNLPLSWSMSSVDENIKFSGLIAPILEDN